MFSEIDKHALMILGNTTAQIGSGFRYANGPSKTPDVYLMDIATFDCTSSPASAQYINNRNAKEFQALHPQAAEDIVDKHYVDDSLEIY